MRKFALPAVLCCAAAAIAVPKAPRPRTFTGSISDSACGLRHMITTASLRQCTLQCVQMGAKFVLADRAHQKVYGLSDQAKAEPLAGEKVEVKGTLKGSAIEVISIAPVKLRPR